jgi:hypothetical protein
MRRNQEGQNVLPFTTKKEKEVARTFRRKNSIIHAKHLIMGPSPEYATACVGHMRRDCRPADLTAWHAALTLHATDCGSVSARRQIAMLHRDGAYRRDEDFAGFHTRTPYTRQFRGQCRHAVHQFLRAGADSMLEDSPLLPRFRHQAAHVYWYTYG